MENSYFYLVLMLLIRGDSFKHMCSILKFFNKYLTDILALGYKWVDATVGGLKAANAILLMKGYSFVVLILSRFFFVFDNLAILLNFTFTIACVICSYWCLLFLANIFRCCHNRLTLEITRNIFDFTFDH